MASSMPKKHRWYRRVDEWGQPLAFGMGLLLGYLWWGG